MNDLHELNKVNIEEPNSNSVRTDTTTHKLVNKETIRELPINLNGPAGSNEEMILEKVISPH